MGGGKALWTGNRHHEVRNHGTEKRLAWLRQRERAKGRERVRRGCWEMRKDQVRGSAEQVKVLTQGYRGRKPYGHICISK